SMHQLYKKIPWWEHQKLAIEKITEYIRNYDEGQTQDYSLISTPTGTGKTGIIAGVAQLCYLDKSVLVIAPRLALRDQLHLKIGRDFFSKFGQLLQELPKEVIRTDENIPSLDEFGQSPKILVSTIQKLVYLESNEREKFNLLINSISLILFDEGHYEPARRWRQIIEQFNCPKVIFTATPFRNDLRPFKIAPEYSYLLTMDEAIEKNIVREVKIKNFPPFKRDLDFIENVVGFFESHRQEDNRVLIRCSDSDEISRLCQFLAEKGLDVVGIHENFSSSSPDWLVKKVPNPNSTNADIWLHQYKLLEGIDDPRFSIAAIYGQLGNTRSVIQQIGRIIRNPKQLPNQIAWVLDWDNHLSQIWENFRRYDSYLREQHEKSLLMLTDENWSLEFLNPQPDYFYFDKNIRKKIDFDDITIESEIQVPLRMNLYEISDDYEQDILVEELCERLNEHGSYVKTYEPRENATVILYIEYSNSRYLKTTTYLQDKLNLIILYNNRNYVCYYDSSGRNLKENEFGIIRSVDRKQLKKLFNSSMDSKLTRVSMKNSNIGLLNIRSKAISAASIGDLPPLLDDRSQVITTAYGLSIDIGSGDEFSSNRRYVGFRNGKVSEYVSFVDFPEYLKWADKIVEIIDRDSSTLPVFNRFAEEVEPPEQTNPTNILLDLIEVQDDFQTTGTLNLDAGQLIQIQDICLPVKNGVFWLKANGLEIP
ncbi:MAG: DEAD/DEAH box helicase family protein, partial [Pseudomonadota bacterium]|nr:DEAD/DEAH box helicase family protein [Pseudomonadota bacterium]